MEQGQSQSDSRDVTVGVVGDGFGALLVYCTAIYLGFRPEQIGIFGESTNPVGTYQQFAWNLGQTVLRSESESHFLPADWPTFAQLDAYSRRDPAPLIRSARRKFNPGVPEILTEATIVRNNLGYADRVIGGRKIGWVVREPGDPPYFSLYDEESELVGRSRHVMLAVGHGPLAFPSIYGAAREDPEIGDRIVQSYEPKQYARGRPLSGGRLGHRFGQRVGQRPRGGRRMLCAAAQPDARRAGPERAPLPLRRQRHRRVPGPRVRGPARLPREGAARHLADAAQLGRCCSRRQAGRQVRGALRKRHGRGARARRPAGGDRPPQRQPGRAAGPHRHRPRHRLCQVGAWRSRFCGDSSRTTACRWNGTGFA